MEGDRVMDFIAIDFETANAKQYPCAVGLVVVENNIIIDEYYTLINPGQPFSRTNVAIHGITAKDVAEAPTFPEVWGAIGRYFTRYPVVAHNASFDKSVLEKTVRRCKLDTLPMVYYDTMGLYRHNRPEAEAFDLPSVCAALHIDNGHHHNALADAKAAAHIMICLLSNREYAIFPEAVSGIYLDVPRREDGTDGEPASLSFMAGHEPELSATTAAMDDIAEILFDGSTFVITGVIAGYDRADLETQIQARGGTVSGNVSKKTRYVIAGLQDVSVVKDSEGAKSRKILKAEALRAEGHDIKILEAGVLLSALSL